MPIAYIDESERSGAFGDRYILSASIPFTDGDSADYRERLSSLLLPNRPKVHWYKAVDPHKLQITELIQSLNVMHCVVIHDRSAGESSERARSKCIEMLAFTIEQFDVNFAVFEARSARLDAGDMKMLNHLRSSRAISGAFKARHVPGAEEALLWMADAACGIVGDSFEGDARYRAMIEAQLHVVSTRSAA